MNRLDDYLFAIKQQVRGLQDEVEPDDILDKIEALQGGCDRMSCYVSDKLAHGIVEARVFSGGRRPVPAELPSGCSPDA